MYLARPLAMHRPSLSFAKPGSWLRTTTFLKGGQYCM